MWPVTLTVVLVLCYIQINALERLIFVKVASSSFNNIPDSEAEWGNSKQCPEILSSSQLYMALVLDFFFFWSFVVLQMPWQLHQNKSKLSVYTYRPLIKVIVEYHSNIYANYTKLCKSPFFSLQLFVWKFYSSTSSPLNKGQKCITTEVFLC